MHESIVLEEKAFRKRGHRVNSAKGGKWKSKSTVCKICFGLPLLSWW